MHKVLEQLQKIIATNMPSEYGIKRTVIGTPEEDYRGLLMKNDFPAIMITPNGEPESSAEGGWANHLTVKYSIQIFVILSNRVPNVSRIEMEITNQGKVLSQITDKIRQLLGEHKTLNGVVRLWSDEWQVVGLTDADGRQVRQILTHWTNDLVPWTGAINDQNNLESR